MRAAELVRGLSFHWENGHWAGYYVYNEKKAMPREKGVEWSIPLYMGWNNDNKQLKYSSLVPVTATNHNYQLHSKAFVPPFYYVRSGKWGHEVSRTFLTVSFLGKSRAFGDISNLASYSAYHSFQSWKSPRCYSGSILCQRRESSFPP